MSGTAYRLKIPASVCGTPFGPSAAVYVLEPPLLHDYGVTSHVIVVSPPKGGLTDVFPCTTEGLMADWAPINGSFRGRVDHAHALRALGYEVVTCDRA